MKYVIYYRVSTAKQGTSGLGLEAQQAYITTYLPTDAIVAEFTEVESGGNAERVELRKAVNLCKRNGYTLAVAKIDRLSRVTEDALNIYSELEGRLFSCDIPNLDKFTLTLFMAIADRERELIKIRTKQALAAKKARGAKLGKPENLTAAGREKAWEARRRDAENNDNNRKAADTVRMYRESGLTYAAIADKLNAAGFRASKGGEFTATQVMRIFNRAGAAK
jgi:DNA invertase Pin-like site-specific DNA recombinase